MSLPPVHSVQKMQERARIVVDEIVDKARAPAVDVWQALLAYCESLSNSNTIATP